MSESLLQVKNIKAGYGEVQVLWDVNFAIEKGAISCIVGSNGAGKTTLLRALSGLIPTWGGEFIFDGTAISGLSAKNILNAGIAHVPEGRRLFKGLSVRDNLLLGAYLRKDSRSEINRDLEWIYSLFPILAERSSQDATTMSGGEQQMCAIGRGLMARPKLLLIDELSLGLAPRAVEKLTDSLIAINQQGLSILLVEQDVMTAFDLASYGVVIETGKVTLSGSTAYLSEEPRVREAYLGV
jgi:branched-chain amino acid transport system ATP-binding protein